MAIIQCGNIFYENIQAILFDKDGTLAKSEDYLRNLAQRRARLIDAQIPGVQEPLLMAFGVDGTTINPGGLQAVANLDQNEVAAAAYVAETGRDWFEALEIVKTAFEEAEKYLPEKVTQTPLLEGSLNCLHRLHQIGLKLGIISGDVTVNIDRFVSHNHLQDYIQLTRGSEIAPAKPDPNCFLQACQTLGVIPEATLMVGDATPDMVMARSALAAGCIGVTWGWSISPKIQHADITLNSWDQILIV